METSSRARDEWIALRCQSGDPDAFQDLVAAMERPLLYYASKLLGSPESALDVLQEVWLRAFRGIAKLKDPASVRSWLYRITYGIAIDRVRRTHVHEPIEDIGAAPEPSFTPDDAGAIHRALDEIDLMHREVLVLHFLEEFSVAEVAGILGCPEGTVKSRIHHAKQAMKQILIRGGYGNQR